VSWQQRAHFFAMSAAPGAWHSTKACWLMARRRRPSWRLDDALTALAEVDPHRSQIVAMGFFGGLSVKERSKPSTSPVKP
jgi:hypothetical protein